jgi:peptidyl-prolyl cis-trans isomerase SurA
MIAMAGAGLALLVLATAGTAVAQPPDSARIADRILAVVGNRVIVLTQVQEQALTMLPRGQEDLPTDPGQRAAFLRNALTALIDEELAVQEAQRDTAIKVTDDEVTQSVDELFRNARRQIGSDSALQQQLRETGFETIEEWRSYTADIQRRRFLADRYWDRLEASGKLKPIPPTDAEVREYFQENRMAIPKRGAAVSFRQIVMSPQPSAEAKAAARALADSILGALRGGADFATAARRFSMDPATREQGGSLNWIRRGQGWDPAFEQAAFSLRVGQVSDPVETGFGYHLIQVERAQPAEVQVRHILIMPAIDSTRADSARALAEEVYRAARAGGFDSLQRLHHDRSEERETQQFPLDRLPPAYATALQDVESGQVAPLFRLEAQDPLRAKQVIVLVTERIPAGDVRFEDVRDQIRSQLGRILSRRRHLETLRRATFVEIRPI